MKSIWKDPPISHRDFVRMYKAKKISVFVHRANALKSISLGYLPKRYFWAHTVWSWIWFISIPAGTVMLFVNPSVGILVLFFVSFLGGKAVKRSAENFVLEYAIENEEFYKMMIQGEVITINSPI